MVLATYNNVHLFHHSKRLSNKTKKFVKNNRKVVCLTNRIYSRHWAHGCVFWVLLKIERFVRLNPLNRFHFCQLLTFVLYLPFQITRCNIYIFNVYDGFSIYADLYQSHSIFLIFSHF